jgi:hypothetical protein
MDVGGRGAYGVGQMVVVHIFEALWCVGGGVVKERGGGRGIM